MWKIIEKEIEKDKIVQIKIAALNEVLTIEQVLNYWIASAEFRLFYNAILQGCKFESYFWEHPPIASANLNAPYEFVLVQSNSLNNITPNESAFQQYFKPDKTVVTFYNLGGDAELIVPTPIAGIGIYPHLSKFVRNAPDHQIDDFWKAVGMAFRKSLGSSKRWLSTAGLGVSWLHVRIDTRPKYYKYHSYK